MRTIREARKGSMSEGPGVFRESEDGFGILMRSWAAHHKVTLASAGKQRLTMDIVIILIVLLLLFGGGGGLYWGMGAGWGIGPIGLIIAVLVIAFLLNGYRGRRGPPLWYWGPVFTHRSRESATPNAKSVWRCGCVRCEPQICASELMKNVMTDHE